MSVEELHKHTLNPRTNIILIMICLFDVVLIILFPNKIKNYVMYAIPNKCDCEKFISQMKDLLREEDKNKIKYQ